MGKTVKRQIRDEKSQLRASKIYITISHLLLKRLLIVASVVTLRIYFLPYDFQLKETPRVIQFFPFPFISPLPGIRVHTL